MKLKSKLIVAMITGVFIAVNSHAALYVHDTKPDENLRQNTQAMNENRPELAVVDGRGRSQQLHDALRSIVRNQMDIQFVAPELRSLKVNWRSLDEPVQIVLTKLSRSYNFDLTIDESKETLFVDVDTGQCDAVRESNLMSTKKMFASLGIKDQPVLPSRLPQITDYSGNVYRLC